MHQYQDLIAIFNHCFLKGYNTLLVKGEDEPLYLPSDDQEPHHRIFFAHGFFASALHECSHWLIAGEARRKLVDFGYWYAPDGRSSEEQKLFQVVEVKPQALEWILSMASGFPFRLSIDNLNGDPCDSKAFANAVHLQVKKYLEEGLSERAEMLKKALCAFYKVDPDFRIEHFDLNSL